MDEELRDLDCAECGRSLEPDLKAVLVSGLSRPMMVHRYGDGTARLVCEECVPDEMKPQG
jgi:hypothetical protein